MSRTKLIALALAVVATVAVALAFVRQNRDLPDASRRYTVEAFSKTQHIDRVYRSMFGPIDNHEVVLSSTPDPEVVWLTSARVDIVDSAGDEVLSPEFLCHSSLKFDPYTFRKKRRNKLFGSTTNQNLKLFTLIQGQTEIRLPEGFGIPVFNAEELTFHSMVINNNPIEDPMDLKVKTTFEYAREADVQGALKPLFRTGASLKVPVDGLYEDPADQGGSCATLPHEVEALMEDKRKREAMLQTSAMAVNSFEALREGPDGSPLSYHWIVPPGRHEYRYIIEDGMPIPFDTTAHYIAVHLHAYAEYMELVDLTTGETVHRSESQSYDDRIGVSKLEHFSSVEGIPLYKDHEYELVTVYDNPTGGDIDAMAVMYLYVHDKEFDVTRASWFARPQKRAADAAAPQPS